MRYSLLFGKTRYSAPSDADSANARFLIQGGFIEREAAGIYSYLPLGWRVLQKINNIIREEMNAKGGQEIFMPVLHPKENWLQTGRNEAMDSVLYRTRGSGDHEFILGPSHEEIVTPLVKKFIHSYKDFPLAVYQIQTKFRNEPRAKAGILRGREFGMKDMYSFHTSEEDLENYYEKMKTAYLRVYERLGLKVYIVEASGGSFSDKFSHEFSVITPAGEDTILVCEPCKYAQNLEIAEAFMDVPRGEKDEEEKPLKEVAARRGPSIEDGMKLHGIPAWKILKTVVYKMKNGLIGVCIRGDLEINNDKLSKFLGEEVHSASPDELKTAEQNIGFISPVNNPNLPFIADHSVKHVKNFCTGANKPNKDYLNANLGRDFTIKTFAHFADVPLKCPKCGKEVQEQKAIEAGNIFKLGTKFSSAFGFTYTDEHGKECPITMGCYGIGNTRLMGAVVEASHDEKGIIWPISVSPYQMHLLHLGKEKETKDAAEKLYKKLCGKGIEVLYDDRNESAGKKLNDADLIGIPWRVIVSKKTLEKLSVEVKRRNEKEAKLVPMEGVSDLV
ncbi:proline--tRNA ligase [Candidatus Peregrinibacteria bacterium]|nr:proline--tRNA ligase [Candidatus Peregrinibacteria bacterium]